MTDDEILRAVQSTDKPFATTSMIMERVNLSDQGVGDRIENLVEEGELDRAKVGGAWIYWMNGSDFYT